jgi:hypothetical protein
MTAGPPRLTLAADAAPDALDALDADFALIAARRGELPAALADDLIACALRLIAAREAFLADFKAAPAGCYSKALHEALKSGERALAWLRAHRGAASSPSPP